MSGAPRKRAESASAALRMAAKAVPAAAISRHDVRKDIVPEINPCRIFLQDSICADARHMFAWQTRILGSIINVGVRR